MLNKLGTQRPFVVESLEAFSSKLLRNISLSVCLSAMSLVDTTQSYAQEPEMPFANLPVGVRGAEDAFAEIPCAWTEAREIPEIERLTVRTIYCGRDGCIAGPYPILTDIENYISINNPDREHLEGSFEGADFFRIYGYSYIHGFGPDNLRFIDSVFIGNNVAQGYLAALPDNTFRYIAAPNCTVSTEDDYLLQGCGGGNVRNIQYDRLNNEVFMFFDDWEHPGLALLDYDYFLRPVINHPLPDDEQIPPITYDIGQNVAWTSSAWINDNFLIGISAISTPKLLTRLDPDSFDDDFGGIIHRPTHDWIDWRDALTDDLYDLIDGSLRILPYRNYNGVFRVLLTTSSITTVVCGEITPRYEGVLPFEEVHGPALPECPEGQFRNDRLRCEIICEENQIASPENVCVDLCVEEAACNTGEVGDCDYPLVNENCEGECLEGFEQVNDICLAACEATQVRLENAECADTCQDQNACNTLEVGDCQYPMENADCAGECLEDFELIAEACLPVCEITQVRLENTECADTCQDTNACNIDEVGACEFPRENADCEDECLDGYEQVNDTCLPACEPTQVRLENTECVDTCQEPSACNLDEVGDCEYPNESADCEGECLDGFEEVADTCLPVCELDEYRDEDNLCQQIPDMHDPIPDMAATTPDMQIDQAAEAAIDMQLVNMQDSMRDSMQNTMPEMDAGTPKQDGAASKKPDNGCNAANTSSSSSSVLALVLGLMAGLRRSRKKSKV